MKRLLTALTILLVGFLTVGLVWAQETTDPLTRALADYDYAFKLYRDAHNDYELAKSQYLAYNNLTSKATALTKTAIMLEARDEVMIVFLRLIKTKLETESKITFGKVSIILQKIDQESGWYQIHKLKLSSPSTIEDLLVVSAEAEERYLFTTKIIQEALFENFLEKESEVIDLVGEEISQLDILIKDVRQQEEDTALVERWQIEAENRFELAKQKYSQAQAFNAFEEKIKDPSQEYARHTTMLEQTNQYLKEVNLNIIEIIREIKYVN